jgi:hypothetical protein
MESSKWCAYSGVSGGSKEEEGSNEEDGAMATRHFFPFFCVGSMEKD